MDLRLFPMDTQHCDLVIESCECYSAQTDCERPTDRLTDRPIREPRDSLFVRSAFKANQVYYCYKSFLLRTVTALTRVDNSNQSHNRPTRELTTRCLFVYCMCAQMPSRRVTSIITGKEAPKESRSRHRKWPSSTSST